MELRPENGHRAIGNVRGAFFPARRIEAARPTTSVSLPAVGVLYFPQQRERSRLRKPMSFSSVRDLLRPHEYERGEARKIVGEPGKIHGGAPRVDGRLYTSLRSIFRERDASKIRARPQTQVCCNHRTSNLNI